MNRRKEEAEKIMNDHLGLFDSPPAQDIAGSRERSLGRLRSMAADPARRSDARDVARASNRRVKFIAVAVAAALVLVISGHWLVNRQPALAVVKSEAGGLHRVADGEILKSGAGIEAGEPMRANGGSSTVLKLSDGSTVEMRSNSELWFERAEDGVRIQLRSGGVIVSAAEQHMGHLYVQTKDLQAIVVGTVFLVSASAEGSRVAVIQGEVRVRHGAIEQQLLPGEEVATSSQSKLPSLKEEMGWSPHAPEHLALLQQSTPVRTTTPAQSNENVKETFEVGSVRIGLPPPPGTGVRGGAGPNGCAGGFPAQIDPKRFAATNKYVYTLITWAFFGNFGSCQNVSGLNLISEGPDWIKSDQFDVEATIPDGAFTTSPTFRDPKLGRMLQSLLEDRFKLVTHRETKMMDVYVMTFDGDASQFTNSKDTFWLTKKPTDWPPEIWERQGLVVMEKGRTAESPMFKAFFYGANATMPEIAPLIGRLTGRPVLERTTLTAKFSYFFEFSADSPPNHSPIGGPLNPGERESLISELRKMGIKLEPSRAPVETLAIDHVEKPSPN